MNIGRFAIMSAVLVAAAGAGLGEAVSFTLGPSGNATCTYPGKLAIASAGEGGTMVTADLSALPADAKLYGASLAMIRAERGLESREKQWLDPVEVFALEPGQDKPAEGAKPLAFEPPWFRSFDVTPAVGKALSAKAGKAQFLVKRFFKWMPEATELRLTFEGKADDLPKQVAGVKAFNKGSNTFITWNEIDKLVDKDEPTIGEIAELRRQLAEKDKAHKLRYRVLQHIAPITAENVGAAKVLAEVAPLSCINIDGGLDHWGAKAAPQNRLVIEDGKDKLPWNTGLYVHTVLDRHPTADQLGEPDHYYAVVTVINGRANLKDISKGNASADALPELPTTTFPTPVLQRDVPVAGKEFGGPREGAHVRLYITWNDEPFTNVPNMYYNWCVATDDKQLAKPAPIGLYLHEWAGTHLKATWAWPGGRTGILVVPNDWPPQTWWTGWSEALGTSRSWGTSVVNNYTERRVLAFLNWVATQWQVDTNRVYCQGGSMGGCGTYCFAMRNGDRFCYAQGNVGIGNWVMRGHFTTAIESYLGFFDWNLPMREMDGSMTTTADRMNMPKWLSDHMDSQTPFLNCANGKDDGAIGWEQAVTFYKALQDTKRPHIAHWGLYGHGAPAAGLKIDDKRSQQFRLDQTQPAFTHCSLDDDFGAGKPLDKPIEVKDKDGKVVKRDRFEGASEGFLNADLRWETDDKAVIDEPAAWGLTVMLSKFAKKPDCTVDITPRRCQKFKPAAGSKFKWTNTSEGKVVQTGSATADKWGLVTLEKVTVTQAGNQIKLTAE